MIKKNGRKRKVAKTMTALINKIPNDSSKRRENLEAARLLHKQIVAKTSAANLTYEKIEEDALRLQDELRRERRK